MSIFSYFNQELAIDLGTANTIITHNDKIVIDEPSIIAIDNDSKKSYCCRTRSSSDAR